MTGSGLTRLFVAIALGVLVTSARAAEEPALVTLDGGGIAQMCAGCSPRQARFAVTPLAGFKARPDKQQTEQPAIVEASFGSIRDASLPPLFQARWELATDGTPLAIVIAVDPRVNRPGNYNLILSLQPNAKPRAPRLTLQLVQAAARIEVVDKLIVTRTMYWPFAVCTDKMTLELREASGVSDLTNVQAQGRVSTAGTEPITGQLVIGSPLSGKPAGGGPGAASRGAFDLPPGGQVSVPYELAGDFPLGIANGAVRFFAPQLTEPATLNFEVRSALTRWYILLAIALGIFISWLLKVYLQNAVVVGEARMKAQELLDRVQSDLHRYKDPPFHQALAQPFRELQSALDSDDAREIESKTTALDGDWRNALQTFADRRLAAQKSLDELRAVIEPAWALPDRGLAILEDAKNPVRDIGAELVANDATRAGDLANALQTQIGRALRESALNWQHAVGQYLTQLRDAEAGVPVEVSAQLQQVLEKTPPELGRVSPGTQVATPAALLQLLQDWATEYRGIRELLDRFARRLEQSWTEFDKSLAPIRATLPDSDAIAKLHSRLGQFRELVERAAADPDPAARSLQQELERLQAAWREAIVKQFATAPDQSQETLLAAREFVKAMQQAAQARGPKPQDVLLKGSGGTAPTGDTSSWPTGATVRTESTTTVLPSAAYALLMPGPLARLRAESRKRIRTAKAWQSLLIGVLMVIWAFGSYTQSYHGTWAEISTIFFGAFGLDLTLDALMSKIRPKTG